MAHLRRRPPLRRRLRQRPRRRCRRRRRPRRRCRRRPLRQRPLRQRPLRQRPRRCRRKLHPPSPHNRRATRSPRVTPRLSPLRRRATRLRLFNGRSRLMVAARGRTPPARARPRRPTRSRRGVRTTATNTRRPSPTLRAPRQRMPLTLTVDPTTSYNWSGYVDTGGTFTSVSGDWTVPTVNCASGQDSVLRRLGRH